MLFRSTKELAIKLKNDINLRVAITKEYKINLLSADAPRIASELLLDDYTKINYTGNDVEEYKKEIRNTKFEKQDFRIGDYLPKFNFKTLEFQELYNEICNSINTFSRDIKFRNYNGEYLILQFSNGGIHSKNTNQKYFSTETEKIISSDVESLYPNLLINYKFFNDNIISLANIYKEVLRKRIAAKKIKLEPDNTILKLVLNSTTGMLDNTYSWLYSPYQVQALRLTGQLIMARLAEECKLHKIQVISFNT